MMNLYSLLPRAIIEEDSKTDPLGETTLLLYGTIYSNKTNQDRHYGIFHVQEPMVITGISGLRISEQVTENDFTLYLAINGEAIREYPFTFPAGEESYEIGFYDGIPLRSGDVISLFCEVKGEEVPGSYVVVRYRFAIDSESYGTLRKAISVVESEVSVDKQLVETLLSFSDVHNCPEPYIPYLSRFLAFNVANTWPTEKKRLFLKNIVNLYHHSGQRISFEAILRYFDFGNSTLYEMFKLQLHPIGGYLRTEGLGLLALQYALFWPGSLIEPVSAYGFSLPFGVMINGMQGSLAERDAGSGTITVYLSVNGVRDESRFVVFGAGESKAITDDSFPPIVVSGTDIVGLEVVPETGSIDDAWLQVWFSLTYAVDVFHAARVEIDPILQDNDVYEALELLRPIHVLILRETINKVCINEIPDRPLNEDIMASSICKVSENLPSPQAILDLAAGRNSELCPAYYYDDTQDITIGWLDGWGKRKKITIKGDNVDANLSSFHVYVEFDNDADLFDALSDGKDIRFTASDGVTHLERDIEAWEGGGGNPVSARVWVRPGTLYTTETDIYVYWNNPDAEEFSSSWLTVWWWGSVSYRLVWHMTEDGTEILDSSPSVFPATGTGISDELNGIVGPGKGFAGGTDRIESDSTLTIGEEDFTMSVWVKPTAAMLDTALHQVFGVVIAGTMVGIHIFQDKWYWIGTGVTIDSGVALVDDTWANIRAVRVGTTLHLYVNGVLANSDTDANDYAAGVVTIGTDALYPLEGVVDEARIILYGWSTTRTERAKFEYHNIISADNELTWGSVELAPDVAVPAPYYVFDVAVDFYYHYLVGGEYILTRYNLGWPAGTRTWTCMVLARLIQESGGVEYYTVRLAVYWTEPNEDYALNTIVADGIDNAEIVRLTVKVS